jgi:hypothetical protein
MTDLKNLLTRLNKSTFFKQQDKQYWRHALEHKMTDAQIIEFEVLLDKSEEFSVAGRLAQLNKATVQLDKAEAKFTEIISQHS